MSQSSSSKKSNSKTTTVEFIGLFKNKHNKNIDKTFLFSLSHIYHIKVFNNLSFKKEL